MAGSEPNPFVGPRPLEQGETLYGRDRELDELYYSLAAERIVLLHSPSGAGKSSLVQAGLLPRLRERFDVWRPTRMGQEPAALETARGPVNRYVLSALKGFEEGIPEDLRRDALELAGQTLAEYFEARPKRPAAPEDVALIFDQFEEVLTVDRLAAEAKREFFDQLGELLCHPRVWALLVLREDYLAPLDPYARQVPTHLRNRFRIDLLGLDGALEAMVEPARTAGRDFPAAERLARDLAAVQVQQADGSLRRQTGRHVEPVQLQVVCRRLWDAMPAEKRAIEVEDLQRFGDVTRALAAYYEDSVDRLAGADQHLERAMRDWFGGRLITAGGLRGQVRRGVESSGGLANEVVQQLLDSHLVRAEQRAGAIWYELAHDRLLEPVREANAEWRAEHLTEVQHRAQLWESQGRPPELLLLGEQLAAAQRWAKGSVAITPVELKFLEESQLAQEAAERERRQARRIRVLAIVASIVGALALVAGVFAGLGWRKAGAQTRKARDLARASTAGSLLAAGDALRGNLVALEVGSPATTPTAVGVLHRALADPVESAILEGHANMVYAAAWSPGGDRLLTASEDMTARLWDAATGELLATLEGHGAPVTTAAWSPGGTRVATASRDSTARVWDPATGEEACLLEGHGGWVRDLAWSPGGERLATASEDSTARVWHIAGGDAAGAGEAVVLTGHGGPVRALAWSPGGERLATASKDGTARIWRAGGGTAVAVLDGGGGPLHDIAWSPGGERLATASEDGVARLWNAAGDLLATLTGHRSVIGGIAWSPDGKHLATASIDKTARIWRDDGERIAVLQGHQDWLSSVAWSPDSRRLLTASYDGTARLWQAATGEPAGVLSGHADAVRAAVWDPSGERVATASVDRTARLWTVAEGEAIAVLEAHQLGVRAAAWSPGGERVVTASGDASARLWHPAEGTAITLEGHTGPVSAAAWSPSGERVATASNDLTARVWSAEGESLLVLRGHEGWVETAAWSPDGERLATGSRDATARLWDAASGELLATLEGHRDWVQAVAWSPGGERLLTASDDATARVWDAGTAGLALTLTGHVDPILTAAWSPGGERIATVSRDATARVWDAASGDTLATFDAGGARFLAAAWSPDGRRLLTACADSTARVWDADTAELLATLEGHGDSVRTAAWSGDGERIVTASLDRTARLWDAASGELLATFEGHRDSLVLAAWSPDGRRLLTASRDATARVWATPADYPGYLMARARARTRLCLEPAFRQAGLGETAAEAERAAEACGACVPRFFERLDGAPVFRWPAYARAWQTYRQCVAAAAGS